MTVENINKVVVVGAGTMGPGIAATFARYGYVAKLSDIDAGQLEKARGTLDFVFGSLLAGSLVTKSGVDSARARLTLAHDPRAAVADADFVVENVSERLEIKRSVLQQLCEHARADAILASDTSGIPISALQAGMKNPGRIIGMHWSNPPHLIPVIEVIKGEQTAQSTVDATVAVVESLGMVPGIVDRDVPGFVENRILYAIMREALNLLDEGVASAAAIDTIVKWGIGYKLGVIGPLALDRSELPRRRARLAGVARDDPHRARHRSPAGARAIRRARNTARSRRRKRRRAGCVHSQDRHHRASPRGNLQDGCCGRSARGDRRRGPRLRCAEPACRRRVVDAGPDVGQYQRTGDHDRGKDRRPRARTTRTCARR